MPLGVEGPIQPDRICLDSGLTIVRCKRSDLCDCFDFPEYDRELPKGEPVRSGAVGTCPVCGRADVTVDVDGVCADKYACAVAFRDAWAAGTLPDAQLDFWGDPMTLTPQGIAEPVDEPQAALIAECRCGRRIWRLTLDSARWRHDNGGVTCDPTDTAFEDELRGDGA